jgi:hypothetical protein
MKLAIAFIFVAGLLCSLAGESFGYPPFVAKARKFGAKDCTFCHVDPLGGPPWNGRGQWLISEKERLKADVIDVEWLTNYKAAAGEPTKGPAGSPETGAIEKELLSLYNELFEAAKKKDTAPFARIMADDFSEINADGLVVNKATVLASIVNYEIETYAISEVATRTYGETAVMTLRQTSKGKYHGQPIEGSFRETIVWTRRDGRWQMVAAQVTRLPAK